MKKGFTLIEVTAVILLIALLTLITVPKIKSIITSKKESAYNSIVSTIKDAAKNYAYMNVDAVDSQIESNGVYVVTIETLKEFELIKNDITNPITNEPILDLNTVEIRKIGNNYTFEFVDR